MSERPTLICVTPVRNEAWILQRFLQCASLWADYIVVADQHSTDETRDIARKFSRVVLIDNDSPTYDEQGRQQLLLDAARRLPATGKRIILALDADEMLTANWQNNPEWSRILAAEPGTVIYFRWVNISPDRKHGWLGDNDLALGFVDDGSPHRGYTIHSPRIPVPDHAPSITLSDIRVLHYQYANWSRMLSKQRWYQCWERIHHPEKRPVTLYRQYHHMHAAVRTAEPLKPEWLLGYQEAGIDMTSVQERPGHEWDAAVLDMLTSHGLQAFRKLDVWDVDWGEVARHLGRSPDTDALRDPRTSLDRMVHAWLARTQFRASSPGVRLVQKALQVAGW